MGTRKNNKLATKENIVEKLKRFRFAFDPSYVLEGVEKELEGKKEDFKAEPETNTFKALTLSEFENGMLMSTVVAEHYQTFALSFSRRLQLEFDCETEAEKSLCELTAVNYARTFEIQRKINNLFNQKGLTKLDVEYLAILSKELDRAQRHYFSSLQTLRSFKQPVFHLNLKADTAVVGQNQIVQTNKHE